MKRFSTYLEEAKLDVPAIAKSLEDMAKGLPFADKKHFMDMAKEMKRTKQLPSKDHVNSMKKDQKEMILGLIAGMADPKVIQKQYGVRM